MQDAFAVKPVFHSHKTNYAIWGSAATVRIVSFDKAVGCKAPGSIRFDGSKLKKKASGLIVKEIAVKPGEKYDLMFRVCKRSLTGSPQIVARITIQDQKSKSIPGALVQTVKDPETFEDGSWQRILLGIDLPAKGKFANAAKATIYFGVNKLEGGSVWFDDVEFFAEEK